MCPKCMKASKKPGKHREHRCERWIIGRTIASTCGCECQTKVIAAIMSHYPNGFPSMALKSADA